MSIDVYEQIPVMESDKFLLREIEDADAEYLLKVYSDKDAVPLFNSDNCVNDFHYVSIEEMKATIAFWKREYQQRYYVRWAIIIPKTKEMFACEIIATKAITIAKERIKALEHMGFCLSEESVIGHDGTKYGSYYVRGCKEWHLILRRSTKNFIYRKISRRLSMFRKPIILRFEEKEIRIPGMANISRR